MTLQELIELKMDVVDFIDSGKMPVDLDNAYEGWADIVGAVHPETVEKIIFDSMDVRSYEEVL